MPFQIACQKSEQIKQDLLRQGVPADLADTIAAHGGQKKMAFGAVLFIGGLFATIMSLLAADGGLALACGSGIIVGAIQFFRGDYQVTHH